MELLILGFILGIAAHILWVKIVVWHTLRELRRNGIDIEELLSEKDEPAPTRNVECRLEQHDGVWMLYRKDNNEFVAQGRSKQELSDAVERRYPDQFVIATEFADGTREKFYASAD
jgi:hypothetical protein